MKQLGWRTIMGGGALAALVPGTAHAADSQDAVALGLVLLGGAFLLFLVMRELMCWYWKVNEGLGLLREIRDRLGALEAVAGRPAAAPRGAPPATTCPKCAAVHPGDLAGQFCDRCGAKL
ncbi:hypothetical protein L6R50_23405 [Myxococcota bacterium]|nr:hypothetical protein [Myxococcota bacterium]